jgi:hypothetical protein
VAARYWTVAEADASLDRVGGLVRRAQRLVAELRRRAGDEESANGHGRGNGHQPVGAVRAALGELVAGLDAEGVVLRDIDRGLIDFSARTDDGREYLLCWLVDEPAVAWWHWPADGFAGRTSIDELP